MMNIAALSATPHGLSWRPIQAGDIDAWMSLLQRMAAEDRPIWVEQRADLEEVFSSSKNDPQENTLFAVDETGTARAFGRVTRNEGAGKAYCWGGVDPQWRRRGIGMVVYQWQQEQAKHRLGSVEVSTPVLRTYAEEKNDGHNALLKNTGNVIVRYWTEMTRPLNQPVPDAALDDGLEFVTFSAELSERVRLAHNEAFKDHWGSEPRDEESWSYTVGHPEIRPEWSMAVVDKHSGEVAGYHIASLDPDFVSMHGYSEGYTELLGVRSAWRGRGIAPAILAEAMRRYRADGIDHAGLQVDTENPSGALGLYERLGYTPTNRSITYDKALI